MVIGYKKVECMVLSKRDNLSLELHIGNVKTQAGLEI